MSDAMFGQDEFWSGVDEQIKASSGSQGTICKVFISFGYKVFDKGSDPNEPIPAYQTFWPYKTVAGDKKATQENMSAAKAQANKYVVERGLTKGPFMMLMIRMYKDQVFSKEVSWKDDQAKFIFPTSMFFNMFVAPNLKDQPLFKGWGEYYARVKWANDPDPKNKTVDMKDRDGNIVIDPATGEPQKVGALLPYIVEIFANEEDARAACGPETTTHSEANTTSVDDGGWPVGYEDEASREMIKTEIMAELAKSVPPEQLADNYGLPVTLVKSFLPF